ncbi:fluoride efflux transporter CrcB [Halomonas sp. FeN2]|uniref:Fluoride-specific ion channel FluC n=1 Tax=Vreelandella neptunia TaxID=115551 RepID=A0ABZ0YHC0_9GAMM|nr:MULTISPECIES: fluoride efflux transporter CrcB [Halomonas]TDW00038.1 CrcB protein [Halomonas alkaliantarctica]MBF59856.1 fluoride efflux transporter CrcB [Halomonas sp.]MDN3559720.1 fluoride efflux transporter CrcB [Halomonas neptunia]UBR50968.1 fluoride efflux transporter CrcB [Halomonas sp. FeN2]WQH11505.1 fluoride efflux transporter CrcB [Halomonas neptunia]|tara:strand:- start:62 stop:463 length:402 start_codon:yes stop_codon:yes gene_type:complete
MGHGLTSVLLVALGGALGGMGRFAISNLLARCLGKAFPWGTLAVNASGAFLAGWLLGSLGIASAPSPLWLFTVAGLLGGYTTVSSFSLQTIELWQGGQQLRASVNIGATLLLGLTMVSLGWLLSGASLSGATL